MSTAVFRKLIWVVIDGFGHEHAQLCLASTAGEPARSAALRRIAGEGYLGRSRPPAPVCQTPPALLGLFAGVGPSRSGVWGYQVPDPRGPLERSVSGFSVPAADARPIWADLEERGIPFALLNVAFRRDAVWSRRFEQLVVAYDGYRCLRRPLVVEVPGHGRGKVTLAGIDVHLRLRRGSLLVRKGGRLLARLGEGEGCKLAPTAGSPRYVHRLGALAVHSAAPAVLRLGPAFDPVAPPPRGAECPREMQAFRAARLARERGLVPPIEAVVAPSRESLAQKAALALWVARCQPARVMICYLPVIDEFNHAWLDLVARADPDRYAVELMSSCWSMIDAFLAELMREVGPDTGIVISSDHGGLAYRRRLHLNEAMAAVGLVRRAGLGYDLAASAAYYHPSDCGQLVVNAAVADRRGLSRPRMLGLAQAALEQANRDHGAGLALLEGGAADPYLAFVYPLADTYPTGEPPREPRHAIDSRRSGGHHLSPLTPDPWIDAVLGIWRPNAGVSRAGMPTGNLEVKDFLLGLLDGGPAGAASGGRRER